MTFYIVRRILSTIPVVAGVIAVVFILSTIVPGDPARIMVGQRGTPEQIEKIRKDMGLDDPLLVQFGSFFRQAITLNFGRSYRNNMPVTKAIAMRIPPTARLAGASLVVALLIGLVGGILSAVRQYSLTDYGSMFLAVLGMSAPTFFVGFLLILVFCVYLRWIPGTGYVGGSLLYLILPAITLGAHPAALIARMTRSSMLDTIRQDYVRTARAKGLSEAKVVLKHALKNAMIPVITIIGYQVANLLSGAIVTEQVFGIPGIGRLALEAILNRDFPVTRAEVLFLAMIFLLASLIVDISYAFFDPRVRYE